MTTTTAKIDLSREALIARLAERIEGYDADLRAGAIGRAEHREIWADLVLRQVELARMPAEAFRA